MPMGIVDDDSLQKELQNLNGRAMPCHDKCHEGEIIDIERKGRKENDVNVPSSLRKIIGETSEIDGRKEGVQLGKLFDISPSSVSAYANSSTSTKTYHSREKEILDHINQRKLKITNRASHKLMRALDAVTDDKLQNAKLSEVASITTAMSAVIKNMEPETKNTNHNEGVQFIVFAPQIVSEDKFQTIDLNE
jgi:hypothetical protein